MIYQGLVFSGTNNLCPQDMAKLLLLCWKTLLVLRRRWLSTFFIVLLPGLVCLSLLLVRSRTPHSEVPDVTTWPNFTLSGRRPLFSTIAFAPNCSLAIDIVNRARQTLKLSSRAFSCERDLEIFMADQDKDYAGVVFHNCSATQKIAYSIRIRSEVNWETNLLYFRFPTPGPRTKKSEMGEPPNYVTADFVTLQEAVDKAIIGHVGEAVNASQPYKIQSFFKRLPYPPYLEDAFTLVIEQQLAMLIVIGFLFPVVNLMKRILEEKSTRIKVCLRSVSSIRYVTYT